MRVVMRTLSAGPAGVRRPGEVHDVDEAEAGALIAANAAREAPPELDPEVEEAIAPLPDDLEQAVTSRRGGARRRTARQE